MKKFTRKTKIIAAIAVAVLLVAATLTVVHIRHARDCHNIVGDGYAMGTDPVPVVIGNSCNL